MLTELLHRLQAVTSRWSDDRGASAVEYALLIAFVAIAIVGAAGALGVNLGSVFSDLAGRFADF